MIASWHTSTTERDHCGCAMKILYLTTVYPGHKKTGGDIGSQRYIDALRQSGAEVDVVSYLRPGDAAPRQPWQHIAQVRPIETAESGRQALVWLAASFLRGTPYSAEKYRSRAYLACVKRLCAENSYAFCVLDHASRMTWVLPHLPKGLKLVANTHNIEHRLYERLCDGAGSPARQWVYAREARRVRAIEEQLSKQMAEIWTVTAEDGDYYRTLAAAGRVCVRAFETPPGDFQLPQPWPTKRYDLGLLGNWQWVSNREGLDWFAEQVLPLLPPEFKIEIGGKGAEHLAGRHPGLVVRGFVPDAQQFLCEARAVAIPSISGAGVQVKSLDSIALGLPVVATSFAVRGIRKLPPTVKVTDDPQQFCRLLAETVASPAGPADAEALAWADGLRRHYAASMAAALADLTPPP